MPLATPLPLELRRAGIVYPNYTRRAASISGCQLPLLCAVLMLETAGGVNEFGHDPTICAGWGEVTEGKYRAYVKLRDATGELQGVGSMQLTSRTLQDGADQAGGCWLPEHNIAVGAHLLAGLFRMHGGDVALAAAAYNGSGPAAVAYGVRAAALAEHFNSLLDAK